MSRTWRNRDNHYLHLNYSKRYTTLLSVDIRRGESCASPDPRCMKFFKRPHIAGYSYAKKSGGDMKSFVGEMKTFCACLKVLD